MTNALDTEDVIVTQAIMPPATWGLYSLCYMQVCAYGEVPPERVEARANALNPPGTSHPWKIVWGNEPTDEGMNGANMAPVACGERPERMHYLLSC